MEAKKEEADLLAYLEAQKFHPDASHVPPEFRDGYNRALQVVIERVQVEQRIRDDPASVAPSQAPSLTDAQCDAIFDALHNWAMDVDNYEFGLPQVSGGGKETGRGVIRRALGVMGMEATSPWQPIETAPKDGTRVMLTCAGYVGTKGPWGRPDSHQDIVHLARFDGEHWYPFVPNNWTHWAPLPAASPDQPKESA